MVSQSVPSQCPSISLLFGRVGQGQVCSPRDTDERHERLRETLLTCAPPHGRDKLTIWNWIGTTRKLRTWTAGQSIKLALRVGMYTSWNLRPRARLPPPSAMVMKEKKHARPRHDDQPASDGKLFFLVIEKFVPNGANMNWSAATRLKAGRVGCVLVSGKALDRNPNHWNWSGAIKKPQDIKRVSRSKSKGGEVFLA